MRKQVMKKAWEIAKKAAARHGHKASEYIGESMKIAWALVKKENEAGGIMAQLQQLNEEGKQISKENARRIEEYEQSNEPVRVEVSEGSRRHKSYIAEIVGKDWQYGIDRKFVSKQDGNRRVQYAELKEGRSYEIQDAGDREYVKVINGQLVEISKDEALEVGIENANEKIVELLNEAIELREKIKGEPSPFSVEEGLEVAQGLIDKSSHSSYIYKLERAIDQDRRKHEGFHAVY